MPKEEERLTSDGTDCKSEERKISTSESRAIQVLRRDGALENKHTPREPITTLLDPLTIKEITDHAKFAAPGVGEGDRLILVDPAEWSTSEKVAIGLNGHPHNVMDVKRLIANAFFLYLDACGNQQHIKDMLENQHETKREVIMFLNSEMVR